MTDLTGKQTALPATQAWALSSVPVLVGNLPPKLVEQARNNRSRPYPWGGAIAQTDLITCRLGAQNRESGLKQVNPKTTVVENGLTDTWRRTDFANPELHGEGHYVYFRVEPQFVPYGTKDLQITIRARRIAPDKSAGMSLSYESSRGYINFPGYWTILADDQWHENTWSVTNASFVGQWGWNFRFDAVGSPNEFQIQEVKVRKPGKALP